MTTNIKSLFPHGSNAFFQANHVEADRSLSPPKPQRKDALALGETIQGEKEMLGRITVSCRGCFVRPRDPDNFAASLKDSLDFLHRTRLIPGDSYREIKLVCEQEKVRHYHQEKLEIEIQYP